MTRKYWTEDYLGSLVYEVDCDSFGYLLDYDMSKMGGFAKSPLASIMQIRKSRKNA